MLVVLLLSISVNAAEPITIAPASSLSRLAEITEQSSPTIRKSRLALEQRQLELTSATASFFPTLDFESSHGPLDKRPDPDNRKTSMTSGVALVLREKFYDNGASITQYKIASRLLEEQRLQYELDRDEVLLKVADTFYTWSAAWQDRQISNNKADLLRRQFNILEAQYKQGIKTKRDVLRIETEVRRLQLDLLRKDNELEVILQRLSAEAGIARAELKDAGVSAEEAKLDAVLPMGPWPEVKSDGHRRARVFTKQTEVKELETRLVERNYWPVVELKGEVSNKYSNYMDTGIAIERSRFWGWSALLTVNYNIWDWGKRSRDLQISRVKERSLQAANSQALMDLNIELREVWLKLREFAESVKMTKELLALEQQSFNILEAEYRNGRATYLDLITNLNSLIDSRSKYATTYFGLKKQLAKYAFHKGTLYEDLKPK